MKRNDFDKFLELWGPFGIEIAKETHDLWDKLDPKDVRRTYDIFRGNGSIDIDKRQVSREEKKA